MLQILLPPNSFTALFSQPKSFELFHICKVFSVNTASDMMVEDYCHIIQKGDKYIVFTSALLKCQTKHLYGGGYTILRLSLQYVI